MEEPGDVFCAAARGDVETLRAILAARPTEGASARGYDGCVACLRVCSESMHGWQSGCDAAMLRCDD